MNSDAKKDSGSPKCHCPFRYIGISAVYSKDFTSPVFGFTTNQPYVLV